MNAVIYARYSSHKQTEMSIEGQVKVCREYAEAKGLNVIDVYVDEAKSAKTANRPGFQKMIEDSATGDFSAVIVFQLDRFARSRIDSGIYRKKLSDNGVILLSAKEDIPDGSVGVLNEGILEVFAEYFSVQLSEKVTRGMYLNAEKCKYNGGMLTLGYVIDADKKYQLDEKIAPIVREVFQKYADGNTAVQIMEWLNRIGVRTAKGNAFTKNSLQHILRNKKYIGTYSFGDIEIENGIPRIVSDELFYKVQDILKSDSRRNGHYKALEEYLLTGKLFCGYCKSKMVGTSGKGRKDIIYRYYKCCDNKGVKCEKRNVAKDYIEEQVINECYALLTDENIEYIATSTVKASKDITLEKEIHRMELLVTEKERQIESLLDQVEKGLLVERIMKRIHERESEISELKKQIAIEKRKIISLSKDEIVFFLSKLREGNINSFSFKKLFVNTFVDKVFLYDDNSYTITYNVGVKDTHQQLIEEDEEFCIDDSSVYQRNLIRNIV